MVFRENSRAIKLLILEERKPQPYGSSHVLYKQSHGERGLKREPQGKNGELKV